MTQAYNLSQLANNLNSSGQLDATDGLTNAVPVANGGTGASSSSGARSNLEVPSTTGGGASGTWGINISGNAATATTATTANSATTASSASTATIATTANNALACSGNSATATQLTTASGSAPSFSARAWVNFNGTGANGENQVIRSSGNVSSVFKNNTGDYTINFTTPMQDANYATVGRLTYFANNEGYVFGIVSATASSVRIYCKTPGVTQSDGNDVSVVIFR